MAENKILPWAQTGTANVLSDADYASDVASGGLYSDGVKTGQASSQQANKTWRQATAPGSGLGQFLVDNLSVDVTDSDTPSTFSTRIANAVLKLAQISPFNQSWATATGGYRKYAIVSDSSGNFWVSTADQNMTVPGAIGAKWQSLFNGYATQSWANSAFVKNDAGNQGGIIAATMDAIGVPSFQSGTGNWYPVQLKGDYATNTALAQGLASKQPLLGYTPVQQGTGINQRGNVVKIGWGNGPYTGRIAVTVDNIDEGALANVNDITNLQNQINNRVLKTGDTMTGGLTIIGGAGYTTDFSPSNPSQGSYINFPGYASIGSSRGVSFDFRVQEHVGTETLGLFTLSGTAVGSPVYWYMHQNGRFGDSIGGNYAYTTEVVSHAQYANDFATSDSRVINLAYGHRIQVFQANVGDGTTSGSWITFPVAFSGTPFFYMANSNGNGDGVTDTDYWCYGANSTGMFVRPRNHQGSANIIVIGPK